MITQWVVAIAVASGTLGAGPAPAPQAPADARHQAEATLSFDLPASPRDVLPLFGPMRESEWSPSWEPKFVFPSGGSNTREGTVFTTGVGPSLATWTLLEYSLERGVVHYVVVSPQDVSELWVRVAPQGAGCVVRVTKRITSLTRDADAAVARVAQEWPKLGEHWKTAVSGALKGGGRRGRM